MSSKENEAKNVALQSQARSSVEALLKHCQENMSAEAYQRFTVLFQQYSHLWTATMLTTMPSTPKPEPERVVPEYDDADAG